MYDTDTNIKPAETRERESKPLYFLNPRFIKTAVFLLFCAGFLFFGFASHAQATNCGGAVACACGNTVTASTTLSSNLTCTGTSLTVGADNVTIDGGNYTITGNGTGRGINNPSGYDNVIIQNLTITGFVKGINFDSSSG